MVKILSLVMFLGLFQTTSEKEAKKLMDKVSSHYQALKSLEIQFSYELKVGNKSDGIQKGSLISKGEMYKLSLPDIDLYCDGTDQYAHLKKNKEIQISRRDESDNRYHPKALASIHKSGSYIFRIEEKIVEKTKKLTVIEFMPSDKNESVFKIKLFINESENLIEKVQWFEKSGKMTLVSFTKMQSNKSFTDAFFKPDYKNLSGVHVEDLRED
ncbi:MAG: outer membrane lipoprotein carrier protein LolA [Saprospiraceae bacterium]|nr:outer membrane lipoprotein carrier protein LolA [Saprospiraceae bacterium]